MQIEPASPFRLSKEPEGTKHAASEHVQISVLPDVGCKIFHRVGQKPYTSEKSRWLVVQLGDTYIYIHGSHVVVTKQELLPTFELKEAEELLQDLFRLLKVEKVEGRYIIDTDKNREILFSALRYVESQAEQKVTGKIRTELEKLSF